MGLSSSSYEASNTIMKIPHVISSGSNYLPKAPLPKITNMNLGVRFPSQELSGDTCRITVILIRVSSFHGLNGNSTGQCTEKHGLDRGNVNKANSLSPLLCQKLFLFFIMGTQLASGEAMNPFSESYIYIWSCRGNCIFIKI